jgi:IS5 family transposase
LLKLDPDVVPRAIITDKGYDAKTNRAAAREHGSLPVIPYRSNAKERPGFFPKQLYRLRARIEILIGKAKRFKRLALRCEKTARNYAAVVALVFVFILIQSVHTA